MFLLYSCIFRKCKHYLSIHFKSVFIPQECWTCAWGGVILFMDIFSLQFLLGSLNISPLATWHSLLQFRKSHCVLLALPLCLWVWAHSLMHSRGHTLKKNDNPFHGLCQLSINPQIGVGPHESPSHPSWNFDWLGFVRSCVGSHSYCELKREAAMTHTWNRISHHSSSPSGFDIFSCYSSAMTFPGLGSGVNIDVSVRAEHSWSLCPADLTKLDSAFPRKEKVSLAKVESNLGVLPALWDCLGMHTSPSLIVRILDSRGSLHSPTFIEKRSFSE